MDAYDFQEIGKMNSSGADALTTLVQWLQAFEREGQNLRFPLSRTFDNEDVNAYFRISRFKVLAPHRLVLCVASITVHQRGRGTFASLLSAIEDPCNGFVSEAICVENVFNTRLQDHLLRQGFTAHGESFAPEMIRFRNPSN